jgi:hypothetical protein
MRWDFVNRTSGAFFSIFVQAKKLYQRGVTWRDHGYNELFHLTGSTGLFQAQMLCDYARTQPATFPLYAFYNQAASCDLARHDGITNVEGLTLADGYEVERRVIAATTPPLRISASSLGNLQLLFFPLARIFCPGLFVPLGVMAFQPGVGRSPPLTFGVSKDGSRRFGYLLPPRPEDIRERLVDALGSAADPNETMRSVVPDVSQFTPSDVLARINRHREGHFDHDEQRAPYWTVTVISADPPQE